MIKTLSSFFLLIVTLNSFSQADTSLLVDKQLDTLSFNVNLPIFSTTGADAESEMDQQDVSSLLQSSRDIFTQFSSFQFGAARYRMRGYAPENQQVMINGVNVNNLETGYSSWSNWGGLNDVTRYIENRFGNVNNRYGFSGPGGYTNIDSKASSFKKGTRISYVNANRTYSNRVMLTHSTGMMQNGWALTLSASTRNGNEVYIPGTYFNASAFYLSVDKRLNDKHLLSVTGFVAPIEQGRSSAEKLEAYVLGGSHYYNSFWGYQNGKVRNSSVAKTQRPMLILSHIYKINTTTQLTSSIFYNYGKSSLSALNWNNTSNPRPDNYYYLPSYFYNKGDSVGGNITTQNWLSDVNTRQINWDKMIRMNQANLYVLPSQLGQGIVTNETRARYILEDKVEDLKNMGFNSVYNKRLKNLYLTFGLNANRFRNRKYKILKDLLGATYWLDYDSFAQNLGIDPIYQQNDIEHPDRKVKDGDKFGYDFSININKVETWMQAEYSFENLDLYGGFSISDSRIWREGYLANGKFPNTSKGLSEEMNFLNAGLKGGFTYKITGRHFITANGSYLSRAPEVNNLFVSPRVRNDIVSGVKSEKVTSGDINYLVKYPGLKFRCTYYYTQINNQTWLRTYYDDSYNNNVNLILKGLNQTNQGIEVGIDKTIFTSHSIQAALGLGQFIYTNRPSLEGWQDNNAAALYSNTTSYLKNYRIGNTPQSVMGIGYKYSAKKHWFAGIYFNYFDKIYLEPNPNRRTAEALSKYLSTEVEQYAAITAQEQLPNYYTINLNGGKSFRVLKKYFLNFNLSVNNLTNNRNIITSGFEILRLDPANVNKFGNKYYYMLGATYMAMINFNF